VSAVLLKKRSSKGPVPEASSARHSLILTEKAATGKIMSGSHSLRGRGNRETDGLSAGDEGDSAFVCSRIIYAMFVII
jgi:hypothetical protein